MAKTTRGEIPKVAPNHRSIHSELGISGIITDRTSTIKLAELMEFREHNIKNHIKNVRGKLHLPGRRQVAHFFIETGEINENESYRRET